MPNVTTPLWLDCRGDLAPLWDPIHAALRECIFIADCSKHAVIKNFFDVHSSLLHVDSLASGLGNSMGAFASVFVAGSSVTKLTSLGPIFGCFYGVFALVLWLGLFAFEHSNENGQLDIAFVAFSLLPKPLRLGYLDFLGSTRWGFLQRMKLDLWIPYVFGIRQGIPLIVPKPVDLKAFELRTRDVFLPAARNIDDLAQGSGALDSINICFHLTHIGAFLNSFSAIKQVTTNAKLRAFGCTEPTQPACSRLGPNVSICDDRNTDLCIHADICTAEDWVRTHSRPWCDAFRSINADAHSVDVNYAQVLRFAVDGAKLHTCDVVVDSWGSAAPILAVAFTGASILVWQCMSLFFKRHPHQDELQTMGFHLLASNPRHGLLATTEKLVAQNAWQTGVLPILCAPPMLQMSRFRSIEHGEQHLVIAAGAMPSVRSALGHFLGEGLSRFTFQRYRFDPVLPMHAIAGFQDVVFIPYNPHALFFMEIYALALPLFVPDGDLIYSLQRSHVWDDQIVEDYGCNIPSLRDAPVDALTGRRPSVARGVLLETPEPFWKAEAILAPSNTKGESMVEQFFFVWNMSPMKTYPHVRYWSSIAELLHILDATDCHSVSVNMSHHHEKLVRDSMKILSMVMRRMLG